MKKGLMTLSVMLAFVLVLTGCGGSSKKLTCKLDDEDSGNPEITVTFNKDKATKLETKMTMEASSEEEAQSGKAALDAILSTQYTGTGVSYNSKVSGKSVVITVTMDVEKMDDAAKENFGVEDATTTYEDAKKYFEAEGYTCK